jgi:uncharacterized membrane protein YhaH (DUF805 family)
MATVHSEANPHTPEGRCVWRIALALTVLVAVASLVLACNQFFVNYLYDQNPHTRTLGGILLMLLCVVGICLPTLLLRTRRKFLSLRRSGQWLLALGIPVLYMFMLILCAEASLRSTNLILPRPALPTAVLSYQPGDSRIEFRGRWGGGGGSNDAEIMDGVEHFSSHIDQGFVDGFLPGAPHHPDRRIVTIVGRAKRPNAGIAEVVLDVDAQEEFLIAVENLDNVKMTRDGEPVGNWALPAGKYQVTMSGRPKRDT